MRKLSLYKQLILWLFGKSIHNDVTDECCPDFSCCNPELKEPFKKRLKYALKYPFWDIKYNFLIWKGNRKYSGC